ncbi:MAG: DUF1574 domain-containing protein [Stigonema ocellatum SAG 48.90 = DSM 106950]|nr:DUF1574 domain-containing protein [Stigonema ocellatum SAG 48.90 = DSM 106950]
MKTVSPDSQQSLVEWVSQATGISTFGVKIRLLGNDLHILCEGSECPQRWRTLSDLLQALQQTNLDVLTSGEQVSIYQLFVYGRKKGETRPKWCHRVYLNQLERHLDLVDQALKQDAETSRQPGGALIISNESLARQGHPDAIARYLSETLSKLGVSVQVNVRKVKPTLKNNQSIESRLWIFCESSYSPDPSLIAEPVAEKLRALKLSGYQDAVIASQVSGESTPDWLLRVDLTPSEVMVKEWARWGDVQAIARLLTEALSHLVTVGVTLKESTLHIFCTPAFDPLRTAPVPDKAMCLDVIIPLLQAIAPQGILSSTVYGQKTAGDEPGWIDWLFLPATDHPALAISPLELAASCDEPAIIFLLERLLNPDLDLRLATGGIRVLLLRKGDLLHIMCDAPVCPARKQIAPKINDFISQLKIPGITGVRVYGRRAGNKEPFWHYGVDFEHRQRLVPEPTPEFAATSAYVRELIPPQAAEPLLRSDLTSEEIQSFVQGVTRRWITTARKFLLETQLFVESERSLPGTTVGQGRRVALVWGTLGLLLTVQIDLILGQIIARDVPPTSTVPSVSPKSSAGGTSLTSKKSQDEKTPFVTNSTAAKSSESDSVVFNSSGFTQTDDSQTRNLAAAPLKQKATSTAILLAARSRIPSFNSRQLEEQLALYRQRLAQTSIPPQVLIIGSSRALRGIDPAALSQALESQGYAKIDIFNFGINGATAQVVDFIIRSVLKPSELPKLIIWADGSRAFNNGREDITFKAIATSGGYTQASQKAPSTTTHGEVVQSPAPTTKQEKTLNSYQSFNQWLNQQLGVVSSTYQKRDDFKNLLNQQLKSWLRVGDRPTLVSTKTNQTNPEEDASQQAVDFDGFLPLSIRFQPLTYYQKHPKVSGDYDNDYKSFQLRGEQDAALQAVLEFTQSQKIPLVFVNMPLTADYLDPVRSKYEQEFQQYMLRLTNRSNFIYRDLSQQWPRNNDYFSDPSHLNRYGAYEVSKKLANDPMIPWPTK